MTAVPLPPIVPLADLVAELRAMHSIPCLTAADRLEGNRELVVALVVAVDRYIDHQADADAAVRLSLWQAMTAANDAVAGAFEVYPL